MDDDQNPANFPMTLDEFCIGKSLSDRRVEMISAFHYTERLAGRTKDMQAEFEARFNAFAVAPVA